MIYIILLSIIYIGIFFSLVLLFKHNSDNFYKVNFLTEKSLNGFLYNVIKKRKTVDNKIKNTLKCGKNNIKYSYFKIKLKKIAINFEKLEYDKKNQLLLWVENNTLLYREKITKIIQSFNKNKINGLFRAYKGKIIINEIAKSYVFLSLSKNDFNCVEHFRKIANEFKFYKKEISILPILVKYYFLNALIQNLNELSIIRKNILKYKSECKFSSKALLKHEVIYSISKYNKLARLINLKHKTDPMYSCYNIGVELLKKNEENKAILMWLDYL